MQGVRLKAKGWGRPNLIRNAKKNHQRVDENMGLQGE
jgi:hypothetical protein